MPIPTTSPLAIWSRSIGSKVSSRIFGSPHVVPVAAARTYSQRGVMTATPNDRLLGLIRCTREDNRAPLWENAVSYCVSGTYGEKPARGRAGGANAMAHRSRPTTNKRQREQARIAKRNDKAARLADRAKSTGDRAGLPAGVDPDIADIRPGPHPLADWQLDPEDKPEEA